MALHAQAHLISYVGLHFNDAGSTHVQNDIDMASMLPSFLALQVFSSDLCLTQLEKSMFIEFRVGSMHSDYSTFLLIWPVSYLDTTSLTNSIFHLHMA